MDLQWHLESIHPVNPTLHSHGPFYLLVLFGLDFVSWIFIKTFQTFLDVKADINRFILTSCSTNISLCIIYLGKGLSCSENSCGIGKCISTIDGFECRCPFGLTGKFCHEEIKIKQPYFDGNAYLTVPEPRHILRAWV